MDKKIDPQDLIYTQNLTNYSIYFRNITQQYKHQSQVHDTTNEKYRHSHLINK